MEEKSNNKSKQNWDSIRPEFTKIVDKHDNKTFQQKWEEAGVANIEEAKKWIKEFDLNEHREIKKWKKCGFDADQTIKYLKKGLKKYEYGFAIFCRDKNDADLELLRKAYYDARAWLNRQKRLDKKELNIESKCLLNTLNVNSLSDELEKLNCAYNKLTSLEASSCEKLKEINCSNNQLTILFLPRNGEKLTNLDVSNNQLNDLSIFSRFVSLKSLNLSKNNLFRGSLGSLQGLKNLKHLNISDTNIDCGLEYLPESLEIIVCNGKLAEQLKKDYWIEKNSYDLSRWRGNNIDLVSKTRYEDLYENWQLLQENLKISQKKIRNLEIEKELFKSRSTELWEEYKRFVEENVENVEIKKLKASLEAKKNKCLAENDDNDKKDTLEGILKVYKSVIGSNGDNVVETFERLLSKEIGKWISEQDMNEILELQKKITTKELEIQAQFVKLKSEKDNDKLDQILIEEENREKEKLFKLTNELKNIWDKIEKKFSLIANENILNQKEQISQVLANEKDEINNLINFKENANYFSLGGGALTLISSTASGILSLTNNSQAGGLLSLIVSNLGSLSTLVGSTTEFFANRQISSKNNRKIVLEKDWNQFQQITEELERDYQALITFSQDLFFSEKSSVFQEIVTVFLELKKKGESLSRKEEEERRKNSLPSANLSHPVIIEVNKEEKLITLVRDMKKKLENNDLKESINKIIEVVSKLENKQEAKTEIPPKQ